MLKIYIFSKAFFLIQGKSVKKGVFLFEIYFEINLDCKISFTIICVGKACHENDPRLVRDLNPGPLVTYVRIIPLAQRATYDCSSRKVSILVSLL